MYLQDRYIYIRRTLTDTKLVYQNKREEIHKYKLYFNLRENDNECQIVFGVHVLISTEKSVLYTK